MGRVDGRCVKVLKNRGLQVSSQGEYIRESVPDQIISIEKNPLLELLRAYKSSHLRISMYT